MTTPAKLRQIADRTGLDGIAEALIDAADTIERLTAAQGEPFGYFRAEPFGWTDCAETDEGAIALYTHPSVVPAGYALIHQDVLREWGKLDEVMLACVYPTAAKAKEATP